MITAVYYTIVFALIQFASAYGVNALTDWLGWPSGDNSFLLKMLLTMTVSSVLVLGVFFSFKWSVVSRSYVRSRPWSALCWCGVAAIGAIIPSVAFQEQMPELPNLAEQEFDMLLKDRMGYYVLGLLAPVVEEIVFRGAVLRTLLGWAKNHWTAIALSALLFALVHGNPAQMPHAFIIGLLLGWMYYRTDSVVPGVVYHWVNNSMAYVLYQFYPDPDTKLTDIFGSQPQVLAAVACSLLILLPALYQLSIRLKKATEQGRIGTISQNKT